MEIKETNTKEYRLGDGINTLKATTTNGVLTSLCMIKDKHSVLFRLSNIEDVESIYTAFGRLLMRLRPDTEETVPDEKIQDEPLSKKILEVLDWFRPANGMGFCFWTISDAEQNLIIKNISRHQPVDKLQKCLEFHCIEGNQYTISTRNDKGNYYCEPFILTT